LLKVLVTGSRSWTDAHRIEVAIFRELYETKTFAQNAVLIHGACPTGADALAEEYATRAGMHIIRRPADWDRHGKRAGFLRNVELVELEPDVCLAFIRDGSKGATMTANLAEKAGIETRRFLA
jgi:YspA, cpYpsA-related SLOG family